MINDLRYAFRILRRSGGYAFTATLTLALGIGANSAIFSVVDGAVLRPLPYDNPDRLVIFELFNPVNDRRVTGVMPRDFLDWRDQQQVFEHVALEGGGRVTLLGGGEPEELSIIRVTAGFFETLRVQPQLGRVFVRDDEFPGAEHRIVISNEMWRRRFAGASDVVGRTLHLNGQPNEIVGVLPAGFTYPAGSVRPTEIFRPVTFTAKDRQHGVIQSMGFSAQARLRDGVTLAAAVAHMSGIQARLDERHQAFNKGYTKVVLIPLLDRYVGNARSWMLTLLWAVGFVLLIACANVANLVLAHSSTRTRELTVRTALGASRGRLARQLLVESLLLAVLGGTGGLLLAWWGVGALRASVPSSIPRAADIALNARVFAFTGLVALATGVICGLLPALQRSRVDLVGGLKEGAGATTGPGRQRTRQVLAWAEVSLATVLLVGAGLFISSFARLLAVDTGIDASRLLGAHVSLVGARIADERSRQYLMQVLDAIRRVPGVQDAAMTPSGNPFEGGYATFPFTIDGRRLAPGEGEAGIRDSQVSTRFFEVLGARAITGRTFNRLDSPTSPLVAVVNEAAVRKYWPGQNPIGARITRRSEKTYEIVGVVSDMRYSSLIEPAAPEVFRCLEQEGATSGGLVIRATGQPSLLVPAVKAAIWAVNPNQPITDVRMVDDQYMRLTARRRFNTFIMGIFGALALAIALTGIYGVMAFIVNQRTQEIGVRLALGADSRRVQSLILREAGVVILTGVAAGLGAAWWLSRTIESYLFAVKPRDPIVFAIVAVVLAATGLIACWIPARRAGRIDPTVALRAQ